MKALKEPGKERHKEQRNEAPVIEQTAPKCRNRGREARKKGAGSKRGGPRVPREEHRCYGTHQRHLFKEGLTRSQDGYPGTRKQETD